jgi:hypothetical protein
VQFFYGTHSLDMETTPPTFQDHMKICTLECNWMVTLRQHDAQGPAVTPLFNTLGFHVGPNITALQSFSCPKRASSLKLPCSGISLKLLYWYLNQCLPYHAQQKIQKLNKGATGFLFLISPHLCHGQKVFLLCASHQPSLYLVPC